MATSISPITDAAAYNPPILSLSEQAQALNQQGANPLEIAELLGVPLPTVYRYLGINGPAAAPTPAPNTTATPGQTDNAPPVISILA